VIVEGLPAAEFEVPARQSLQPPDPLVVSLVQYQGRETAVELVQQSQDDRAMVEWRAIELAGPPMETK